MCPEKHVNRELSKARKLFNIALGKEWIFKTPFRKEASKELIQEAAETPSPVLIRELTDEESERVMKALNTPERRHTLPVFIAVQDTGSATREPVRTPAVEAQQLW